MAQDEHVAPRVEREDLVDVVVQAECEELQFFDDRGRTVCGVMLALVDRPVKEAEGDHGEHLWMVLDDDREASIFHVRGKYVIAVRPAQE